MIFNDHDITNYHFFRILHECWSQQNLWRVMFGWVIFSLTLIALQISSWILIIYTSPFLYHFGDDKHLKTIHLLRWGSLNELRLPMSTLLADSIWWSHAQSSQFYNKKYNIWTTFQTKKYFQFYLLYLQFLSHKPLVSF